MKHSLLSRTDQLTASDALAAAGAAFGVETGIIISNIRGIWMIMHTCKECVQKFLSRTEYDTYVNTKHLDEFTINKFGLSA